MTTAATRGLLPYDLAALPELTATLAATAERYDRTGEFPIDGIAAVHDAGLLTASVAPEFGGTGLGLTDLTRVLFALGQGDPSVALIASMTLLPHAFAGKRPWHGGDVYSRILAESAARPTLVNNARVEPELGSPARGGLPATLARRTSSGWSISGSKRFVTGADGLAYFLVWASTDEPVTRVGTFVVPADAPGIEIVHNWQQLGMRASGSHDVVFSDVEIPADYIVDIAEAGVAGQDNLAGGPVHIPLTALYLGAARGAQEYFHRFAHERVPANLGRPVATTERFKSAAGEIEVLLSGAERGLFDIAERFDRGEAVSGTAALGARVLAVRNLTAAVGLAVKLLGNPGLSQHNPLERYFRDVQSAGVHAPQEDTSLATIGTAVLTAAAPTPSS
jgi:alkylation response protein AidB-like acyl-CoA dehydrogenase